MKSWLVCAPSQQSLLPLYFNNTPFYTWHLSLKLHFYSFSTMLIGCSPSANSNVSIHLLVARQCYNNNFWWLIACLFPLQLPPWHHAKQRVRLTITPRLNNDRQQWALLQHVQDRANVGILTSPKAPSTAMPYDRATTQPRGTVFILGYGHRLLYV